MDGGKAHRLALHLPFDHQSGPPALHGSLEPTHAGHIPEGGLRIFSEDHPPKLLLNRVHLRRFTCDGAHHKVGIPGSRVPTLDRAPEGCAFSNESLNRDRFLIHGQLRLKTERQLAGSGLRPLPRRINRSGHQQGIHERDAEIGVEGDARAQRGWSPEQSLDDEGQGRVADGQRDLRRVFSSRVHLKRTQGGGPPGDNPRGGKNFESLRTPVDAALPVTERHSVEAAAWQVQLAVHHETVLPQPCGPVKAQRRTPSGVHPLEVKKKAAKPTGIGAADHPQRTRHVVAQVQRPIQVHRQEIGLKCQPIQVKPVPADAELHRERRGDTRQFLKTNHPQLGADLSVHTAFFGHPEIERHLVRPDFPRREEIAVADGRPRNRKALRREREATRERLESRSATSRIGTWLAPVVPCPVTQPLDRQTFEMETRQRQGP